MRKPDLRTMALILGLCAGLGGCGGGGGGGEGGAVAGTPTTPDDNGVIPAAALQSVDGLIAHLRELLQQASETAEPIALGNAVLPTSETSEPLGLN